MGIVGDAMIIFSILLQLLLLLVLSIANYATTDAFSIIQPQYYRTHPSVSSLMRCNKDIITLRLSADDSCGHVKKKGDSLRDATGIRPSLHPTTINCIAEALLLRSRQCVLGGEILTSDMAVLYYVNFIFIIYCNFCEDLSLIHTNFARCVVHYIDIGKSQNEDGKEMAAIDTANTQSEPLQIAITAGGIAMSAIDQRTTAAKTDETTDKFTIEESQVISGRVVGVVMRMRDLERLLVERVNGVTWVTKYGEEESFGLLKIECQATQNDKDVAGEVQLEKQLAETIKTNPLFRMNRAECLLSLFLSTVEKPQMKKLGQDVPGGSEVDFIDADRLEVLDC